MNLVQYGKFHCKAREHLKKQKKKTASVNFQNEFHA